MINGIYGSETTRAYAFNQLNSQRKSEETPEMQAVRQVDSVSISGEAYAYLSAQETAESAAGTEEGGSDLLSSDGLMEHLIYMLNNLEEITEDYQADLKRKLRGQGIDVDTEIKLTTGKDGSVKVKGDHPDKAEIEQYFKDNPEMRDRFWISLCMPKSSGPWTCIANSQRPMTKTRRQPWLNIFPSSLC